MILPVPYDSQRDNKINPSGACNVTSLSMAMNYILGAGTSDPDILYEQANQKAMRDWIKEHIPGSAWMQGFFDSHSANMIWSVLEHLADDYLSPDYDCFFKGITGYREVERAIKVDKMPVMLGTNLTDAGHIILLVGIEEPYFVCHDPYGDANKGYKSGSGEFVRYSYNFLWNKVYRDRGLFFRKLS